MSDGLGEMLTTADVAVLTREGAGQTVPMLSARLADGRVVTLVLTREMAERVRSGLTRMLWGTE